MAGPKGQECRVRQSGGCCGLLLQKGSGGSVCRVQLVPYLSITLFQAPSATLQEEKKKKQHHHLS